MLQARSITYVPICHLIIFTILSIPGNATAADKDRYPLLFTSFSGSNNDPGWLFKLDTTAGYRFNRHFEITAGLPVYFVQVPTDTTDAAYESKTGIGNVYIGLRVMGESSRIYFSSSLRGSAPTGNDQEGFSTGRAVFDWNNYIEYDGGKWTPFGSAGIANSISDTHFFTRPFTSNGMVGQFEGGVLYHPDWWISFGSSGYAVVPTGEQEFYSRLYASSSEQSNSMISDTSETTRRRRRAFEESYYTVSDADIAEDHGFSVWADIYTIPGIALEMGYSRSVSYEYNTLFFSARFDLAAVVGRTRD